MALGDPLRDGSYFLRLALDTEVRRTHERALLRHHLDARAATRGRAIAWDDAWHRHRIHAAHTVPASCQALVATEDAGARAREFPDTFLARAVAVVEDLEAPEAVTGALASQGCQRTLERAPTSPKA
ncbi:MAG: hypothetical protein U0V73_02065 [Acidimicrobiia bacterium]